MSMDIQITMMGSSATLAIHEADRLAEGFFRHDPSSAHADSYDAWAQSAHSSANRLVADDVHAINRTMAARSPLGAWQAFMSDSHDLPALAAIDSTWDLLLLSDDAWHQQQCRERITELLRTLLGPHRQLAVTTKVLHLKRPRLIPVLDSYVVQMLGGAPPAPEVSPNAVAMTAIILIEHLREQGRANLPVLQAVQQHLAARGIERTLVRILDALLWLSHPGAWSSLTYQHLGWPTVGISIDAQA